MNFQDADHGLYGNGSFDVVNPYCSSSDGIFAASVIKASSVAFSCEQCGVNQYSLDSGGSDGQPGASYPFTCLDCPPVGAVCMNGAVTALPGFWGAASASAEEGSSTISMIVCPPGFCCTPGNCHGYSSCAGHRTGPLCAECPPGYTVGLGSPVCMKASNCQRDQITSWTLVVVLGLIGMALLQLTLVSDVWGPSSFAPNGALQLFFYFLQVCREPHGMVRVAEPHCFVTWLRKPHVVSLPKHPLASFSTTNYTHRITQQAAETNKRVTFHIDRLVCFSSPLPPGPPPYGPHPNTVSPHFPTGLRAVPRISCDGAVLHQHHRRDHSSSLARSYSREQERGRPLPPP
jgi:hypothetical protein